MSDDLAIRLFVAKGNPAVLWHAIDEAERLPYRLEAARLDNVLAAKNGAAVALRRDDGLGCEH